MPPLSINLLRKSEQVRYGYGKEEEDHYQEQKVKTPPQSHAGSVQISPTDSVTNRQIKSRRLRRLAAQAAERRREQDEQRLAEQEGVPIPNPPQQEISAPQRVPPRARGHPIARRGGGGGGVARRAGTRYIMRRRDSEAEAEVSKLAKLKSDLQ